MSQELHPAVEIADDPDVKRDKFIMVRLTAVEQKAWQAAADAAKRTLADWVRVVIDEHLEVHLTPPSRARQQRNRAAVKLFAAERKKGR